jgi:methylenetetrahydrofolate dehydrogenase (NADP+)/methenyltetrahydrofolate cyclohydrolase
MPKILYGKDAAAALCGRLMVEAKELLDRGVPPTLAIVRVGERGDDIAYERGALKRCGEIGVSVRQFVVEADISESGLLDIILEINRDDAIHGCLLFRPLPAGMDEHRICNALAPEKDVDGITDISLAGVFSGSGKGYPPCTAQACMELMDYYGLDLHGKRVTVVGRSLVIGKPAAMMALAKNATVTLCHSRTANLAAECRSADVLVVAMGRAGLVDESFINHSGTVIDVGINMAEGGGICGDVPKECVELSDAYSPVPGGVGAMTTSVLAKHVLDAARRQAK